MVSRITELGRRTFGKLYPFVRFPRLVSPMVLSRSLSLHQLRRPLPPLRDPEEVRQEFISLSKQVLEDLKDFPEDFSYRDAIHRLYTYRLRVAEQETEISRIEQEIEAGDMDELIQAAKDEINIVLPLLKEHKFWLMDDDNEAYKSNPNFKPWVREILVE